MTDTNVWFCLSDIVSVFATGQSGGYPGATALQELRACKQSSRIFAAAVCKVTARACAVTLQPAALDSNF